MILHNVTHNWAKFTAGQKKAIKDQTLALLMPLSAALSPTTTPQPHLAQKVADILSELAKREWPQQWPHFHTQLLQLAMQNGLPAVQAAVATFASLSEDATSLLYQMQLPGKRRAQLREGLRGIHTELVALCLKFARAVFPQLKSANR